MAGTHQSLEILRRIDAEKGVCVSSPALYDAYWSVAAAHVKNLYTFNYSLADPIHVLSKGNVHVEETIWTPLSRERIDELFARIKGNPGDAILYRNCRDRSIEKVDWYNHEPEVFRFFAKLEAEKENLILTRNEDARQTEFVLVRWRGSASGQPGAAGQGR